MAENENSSASYSQEFIRQINNAPEKQPINTKFLIIGGVLLVALIAIVLLIMSAGASKPISVTKVLARTRSVEKITKDYHKLIDDTTLRSLNSSLTITLTNFNRDGETYYKATATKEQLKQEAKSRDADLSEVTKALDTAELNNRFDRHYVIQMSYQIDLIIAEQEKLLARSENKDLITTLNQSLEDLRLIQTQLKELSIN